MLETRNKGNTNAARAKRTKPNFEMIVERVPKQEGVRDLLGRKFWEEANWIDIVCEVLFHIKRRNTTIQFEIYAGIVQFISCMYVLPVIPEQMINAGYHPDSSYVVTVRSSFLLSFLVLCCLIDLLLV